MKLKENDLMNAIQICSGNHSTKITLNYVHDGFVPNAWPLVIHNCCASVINELKDQGYSLSMHKGVLIVSKY